MRARAARDMSGSRAKVMFTPIVRVAAWRGCEVD
jgi:hypothetical protein